MDIREQKACNLWLRSLMAEDAGPGRLTGSWKADGQPNESHPQSQFTTLLHKHLTSSLVDHIQILIDRTGNYWEAWPQLTEAELGEVMKAGAANFFEPATP